MNDLTKIILITAVKGDDKNLANLIKKILPTFGPDDIWIIAYDNQEPKYVGELSDKRLKILVNNGQGGAGLTRNIALDYITTHEESAFILYPLDADDEIMENTLRIARIAFEKYSDNIISFGHKKCFEKKDVVVGFSGVFSLHDQLKRYRTPCGSTFIKFEAVNDLKNLKFGSRKRANDQIFFINAIKKYGSFRCIETPILNYQVTGKSRISSNKSKMPLYKFLALRDVGIPWSLSFYYFGYYVIAGFLRYIFKVSY